MQMENVKIYLVYTVILVYEWVIDCRNVDRRSVDCRPGKLNEVMLIEDVLIGVMLIAGVLIEVMLIGVMLIVDVLIEVVYLAN